MQSKAYLGIARLEKIKIIFQLILVVLHPHRIKRFFLIVPNQYKQNNKTDFWQIRHLIKEIDKIFTEKEFHEKITQT